MPVKRGKGLLSNQYSKIYMREIKIYFGITYEHLYKTPFSHTPRSSTQRNIYHWECTALTEDNLLAVVRKLIYFTFVVA